MNLFSKSARHLALGLAMTIGLAGAAAASDAEVFPDTSRIATIGSSLTEIVFALGEGDHLVARDSTSVYPEAALKLPDVGYMRQLSPEGVLSVNPSGILALEGSGPKEAVDVLKKASVPYIEVPETFDHEGILSRIRIVGKALGVEERAAALAADVDGKLKAAEALTASVQQRKRVLFILSMQGGKLLAAGGNTAADGILKLTGADNAIDGLSGYKQLSDEAIVTAAPDAILMMDHAGVAVSDDDLFDHAAIAQTPAGAERRVIRMDGNYLLGFGPRTADAIHDLAVALYGTQIGQ
jgi:iron complex transport system substrate-binding protein